MNAHRATLLAWGLAAFAVALQMSGFVVVITVEAFEPTSTDLLTTAIAVAFSAVGALVAKRHPRSAIGWIFLGVAVSSGLGGFAHGYVQHLLSSGGTPSFLAETAATYAEISWIPFVLVPPSFLILLFPDGHLPSRRWRPVAWAAAAGIAGTLATSWVAPGPLADFPELQNSYGIDSPLHGPLMGLAYSALFVGVLGSAASVVVRFRRGQQEQRQQIKWLAVAGAVAAVALIANLTFYDFLGEDVANGLIMFAVLGLPAAAGIAILRHRLYDIDVVINRTLVYAALTATLAGIYLGSVLLTQRLLSPMTASNNLAIAVSTLAVAALFQPPAAASRLSSTAASTAASTTRPEYSSASVRTCATRSTLTPSATNCAPSSPTRCSQPTCRSGCGNRGRLAEDCRQSAGRLHRGPLFEPRVNSTHSSSYTNLFWC